MYRVQTKTIETGENGEKETTVVPIVELRTENETEHPIRVKLRHRFAANKSSYLCLTKADTTWLIYELQQALNDSFDAILEEAMRTK